MCCSMTTHRGTGGWSSTYIPARFNTHNAPHHRAAAKRPELQRTRGRRLRVNVVVMLSVDSGVYYTQAHGCRFCLHIGTIALYFGRRRNGRGPRLELFTPKRWFRWSPGYVEGVPAGQDMVLIANDDLRKLTRHVALTNWLIEMRCHVIEDSCLRPDSWVCVDVDGEVVGRGVDYYDAIQKAKDAVARGDLLPSKQWSDGT